MTIVAEKRIIRRIRKKLLEENAKKREQMGDKHENADNAQSDAAVEAIRNATSNITMRQIYAEFDRQLNFH